MKLVDNTPQDINVLIANNDKTIYILKRKLRETNHTNPKIIRDIIKDPSILSTETLIKEIIERGAKSITFS